MFAGFSFGWNQELRRDYGCNLRRKVSYVKGTRLSGLKVCFYYGWRVADAGNKVEHFVPVQRHLNRRGAGAVEDKCICSGSCWDKLSPEIIIVDALQWDVLSRD